ncbi:N-formylglutamate amidohydrolase [Sneathiella sp. P13V-1]|uniref:N-formylglutamate amidohydrolase n=1 Tax=Sneathiella sp. P13V-1 TaxID=2697366 RepID=UPI00187B4FC8|nr:N-formylglutamate amidohydrolase [Sneathiella sp. P13V-1]MBE7635522.1 N-formylglutamate amidohydrolase [Sneathiella sp. P13V-1]
MNNSDEKIGFNDPNQHNEEQINLVEPGYWDFPAVFSSPHSGQIYSDSFLTQTILDPVDLRRSEDFCVDELFEHVSELGAPLLAAHFPRAYCDVNRAANELDTGMFEGSLPLSQGHQSARVHAGLGVIPSRINEDLNIYSGKVPSKEAVQRLEQCYHPYHKALKKLLYHGQILFDPLLLIDCHSMPGHLGDKGQRFYLADIVLGSRFKTSCPVHILDFVAQKFREHGLTVSYDEPYAGGYITQTYSLPARGTYTLQIELNRNLYMLPGRLEKNSNFTSLQSSIRQIMTELKACLISTQSLKQAAE